MKLSLTHPGLALPVLAGLALALVAVSAAAAPPAITLAAAGPVLDLSRASPLPYSPANAAPPPGIARTSVDARLGPGAVVGQLGFLCGRQPGQGETGSASAFGYDPHGRFLGAKLSRAF
jgi:hypothetical protein